MQSSRLLQTPMSVYELAKKIGYSFREEEPVKRYAWDGSSLNLLFMNSKGAYVKRSDNQILHELCHWLVAEEWQRSLPEYGLNTDSFSPPDDADHYGPVEYFEQEYQEMACWSLQMRLAKILKLEEDDKGLHAQLRKQWVGAGHEFLKLPRQYAVRGIRELRKRM
jgi:hypothetical protein